MTAGNEEEQRSERNKNEEAQRALYLCSLPDLSRYFSIKLLDTLAAPHRRQNFAIGETTATDRLRSKYNEPRSSSRDPSVSPFSPENISRNDAEKLNVVSRRRERTNGNAISYSRQNAARDFEQRERGRKCACVCVYMISQTTVRLC